MEYGPDEMLFALLRSGIRGAQMAGTEWETFAPDMLSQLCSIACKHDIAPILGAGLDANGLKLPGNAHYERIMQETMKAAFRQERMERAFQQICAVLEENAIAYIPLKGAVIRNFYPEPWMRTSCDIDILVRREALEPAIAGLVVQLGCNEAERAAHDVSLHTPSGQHIELHFDLVEEGRAKAANAVLADIWHHAQTKTGWKYQYEMPDAWFYFYHIAHMVKHFEVGGCGIRPLIDLWILDHLDNVDCAGREALLERGGLLQFAKLARHLSECWLENAEPDEITKKMQRFILSGGVYGSAENRVALQQTRQGGKAGYLLSRVLAPYDKLRRYYPILEKYPWLMPAMQVRRWGMLLRPEVAGMAKRELSANKAMESAAAADMNQFLEELGL